MRLEKSVVVHIVNQMRPGGIETMVLDITRSSRHASRIMSLEGSTQTLLANWGALSAISDAIEGLERPPGFTPGFVLRLARRLRQLKPKAVFLHRLGPLLYGGLAARLAAVPTIVHVEHDVWQYDDSRRRRLLEWSVRLVRPVHFAVSPAIAETLGEILPDPEVHVVPGGVDLSRFCIRQRQPARAALALPADARIIGSAGRLEQVKGHRVLVAAMDQLPANVHVVLIGEGREREALTGLAHDLGVESRVHLLGHRDDLELILPALDIFCLPSLGEGLPRVLMEAQAAGIPIVASDVGSVRQIVDPATGRLVAASDPAALASALTASLNQPAEPSACRAYAVARFGIDRLVAAYDDVVDRAPHNA